MSSVNLPASQGVQFKAEPDPKKSLIAQQVKAQKEVEAAERQADAKKEEERKKGNDMFDVTINLLKKVTGQN